MTRLFVVAAVVGVVALGTWLYARRQARLDAHGTLDHPPLPAELRGPGRTWIVFATELCATCGPVADRLRRQHPDDTVRIVGVEDHPALAERYGVRTAPTLLEVDANGSIISAAAGAEPVLAHVA